MNFKPSANLIKCAESMLDDGYTVTFYRTIDASGLALNFMAIIDAEQWTTQPGVEHVATIDSVDALNAQQWEGYEL